MGSFALKRNIYKSLSIKSTIKKSKNQVHVIGTHQI